MHDSVMLESAGRPTAAIVTQEFVLEAETQRDALGMTGLSAVVIDHPLSSLTDEEITRRIEQAL
ncbi:MAG TPA: UGSC family (seleno)protein, partial [Burkholderiales bacterium]|nr:UGSC family (seleno)protein [Burkholderiales bacterium]